MVNHYTTIRTAIIAKLNALTGVKYVYTHEQGELAGYPAISIYSSQYSPAVLTNQHDYDEYVFTVHLYQEMVSENTTAEQAEVIVDNIMVALMQAFQSDYTLGGACDDLTISAQKGWVDREMINRACVFNIAVRKATDITH